MAQASSWNRKFVGEISQADLSHGQPNGLTVGLPAPTLFQIHTSIYHIRRLWNRHDLALTISGNEGPVAGVLVLVLRM